MVSKVRFNKKYTIRYVKKCFEEEGYTLLSDVYVNCKQKLNYICPKGHKSSICFDSWFNGSRRCGYCSGRGVTIDEIRIGKE